MPRAKYLTLDEARKKGLLDRFAEEHPNETDAARFDRLLEAMATKPPYEDHPRPKKAKPRKTK